MSEDVAAATVPSYAVKQIRGPFLELPAHPGHAASETDLAALCTGMRTHGLLLAADLFSGTRLDEFGEK
jgi:DNA (cytosine-5)-methyltransferase 1